MLACARLRRLFLAACVLALPALGAQGLHAGPEEPDPVEIACRGIVSDLLRDLREGDEGARAEAGRRLLARARFALPYVSSAAESTADPAWREHCLAVAETLRRELPDGTPRDAAEVPSWERVPARLEPAPQGPGRDLATARRLLEDDRWQDAAETLLAFATEHPDRLVEALEAARHRMLHVGGACHAAIRSLEALATVPSDALPAGERARRDLALAGWYRDDRDARLQEVARRHPDTPEALQATRELIQGGSDPIEERVERLRALADAHPGTEAAREALEHLAFQYASSNLAHVLRDPLERFRALAAIAARLQTDEFPGPEGALVAVEHMTDFYIGSKPPPKATAEELLDAFRTFFTNHLLVDVIEGTGTVSSWHLPDKLADLHGALGAPAEGVPAAVERELAEIERALPDPAAMRYLRAERRARAGDAASARTLLTSIEEEFPLTLYGRKALAARASVAYWAGDLEAAESLYARYLELHPSRAFAWLAGLRIGHCRARRGDTVGALHAYEAVDASRPAVPRALGVLRAIALARCHEDLGEIEPALARYREALAAWPPTASEGISTLPRDLPVPAGSGPNPDGLVTRVALLRRVRWLARPGLDRAGLGRLLLGDRLHHDGRTDEALREWAAVATGRPDSPLADEARERSSRAWVDRALAAAAGDLAAPDADRALAALAQADAAGGRFGRVAAALVHAALLLRAKQDAEAESRLRAALESYAASQSFSLPAEGLAGAAAALLVAAFQPQDPRYGSRRDSGPERRPYVVLPSTVEAIQADGTRERVDVRPRLPQCPNVLYFEEDQLACLESILGAMGVVVPREQGGDERSGDETRSRLPGDERAIADLLGRFFAVRPGHWGGWHLFAYPLLTGFRVADAEGTRAVASFRVGFEGGDAFLERDERGWRLVEVEYSWIE